MIHRVTAAAIAAACLLSPTVLAPRLIAPAAAQERAHCHIEPYRGMTQPGGATTTMRVVNDGQPCRSTFWMRTDPQRVPFEAAEIAHAPANGSATATGNGFAYTPRQGFRGADTFTVATRGVWQGVPVTGRLVVTVIVLPRP